MQRSHEHVNRCESVKKKRVFIPNPRGKSGEKWGVSAARGDSTYPGPSESVPAFGSESVLPSRREPLRRFARTVREHLDGILGFLRHHGLTSAVAEGFNNKIKLVMHRAFGFASFSALTAMIYLCCSGMDIPLT